MLHERHFRAMNTDVGVWVWSTAAVRAPIIGRSLEWAEGVFARVEDELSRFRSTSALSRLNQAAGRGPQAVSPLLWTVLLSALQAADDSGGIYDPTLLRTLERIGYDRSFEAIQRPRRVRRPSPAEPAFGSWRRVRLDDAAHSVSLPTDVALDFGGIAKGWTVDHVASALAPLGPVLVDAGGDLRVIGAVGGEAWPIAVQDAFEPERDRAVVRLGEGALATSSIGGRQWHRGGRMLHHVIDPRTGTAADERPPFRDGARTERRDGRRRRQGRAGAGQRFRIRLSARARPLRTADHGSRTRDTCGRLSTGREGTSCIGP